MCHACYAGEHSSPTVASPEVLVAAASIAGLFEHAVNGGALNLVLENWNLGEEAVVKAYEDLLRRGPDPEAYESWLDRWVKESACALQLLSLSETERASAIGLYEGFWSVADVP